MDFVLGGAMQQMMHPHPCTVKGHVYLTKWRNADFEQNYLYILVWDCSRVIFPRLAGYVGSRW